MRKADYRACVTLFGPAILGGLVITTAATANAEVVKLQVDLKGSNASEQLARTFVRGHTKRVAELLDTLVSLGQARELADGRHVRV